MLRRQECHNEGPLTALIATKSLVQQDGCDNHTHEGKPAHAYNITQCRRHCLLAVSHASPAHYVAATAFSSEFFFTITSQYSPDWKIFEWITSLWRHISNLRKQGWQKFYDFYFTACPHTKYACRHKAEMSEIYVVSSHTPAAVCAASPNSKTSMTFNYEDKPFFHIRPSPFFRLATNAFSDIGSVGRIEKKKNF